MFYILFYVLYLFYLFEKNQTNYIVKAHGEHQPTISLQVCKYFFSDQINILFFFLASGII